MQEHQDSAQKHIRSWPLLEKREFSSFFPSLSKRQFTIIVCFSSHVGEMKGGGGGEKAIYESEKKKGDMMMLMSNTDDPLLSRSVYG